MLCVDENNALIIPQGYKYCDGCDAITPHMKRKKPFLKYICKICGDNHFSCETYCPNCHWEETDSESPLSQIIIIHNDGCHLNDEDSGDEECNKVINEFYNSWMKPAPRRTSYILPRDRKWYDKHCHLQKRYNEMKNMKCKCPRYKIYTNSHIFNYSSNVYPSMDCMNAVEWNYDVRCPICGCIFHISDTNC